MQIMRKMIIIYKIRQEKSEGEYEQINFMDIIGRIDHISFY